MTAPAERKAANKRISKPEWGQSCSQAASCSLAIQPASSLARGRHCDHDNTAGYCCHGPDAVSVSSKHQRAPHLSLQSRGWVRTLLRASISSKEIMHKHQKQFAEDECAANSPETASSSVKMCATLSTNLQRKHGSGVRMKQRQYNFSKVTMPRMSPSIESSNQRSLPLTASQVMRRSPFVTGVVTDDMRAAVLKYGHNNVVCIDATFATKHRLKFPQYTAAVVDDHGNGLPILEILSESTAQPGGWWHTSSTSRLSRLIDAHRATWQMMHMLKSLPSGK